MCAHYLHGAEKQELTIASHDFFVYRYFALEERGCLLANKPLEG
jgi:hypothetical protein